MECICQRPVTHTHNPLTLFDGIYLSKTSHTHNPLTLFDGMYLSMSSCIYWTTLVSVYLQNATMTTTESILSVTNGRRPTTQSLVHTYCWNFSGTSLMAIFTCVFLSLAAYTAPYVPLPRHKRLPLSSRSYSYCNRTEQAITEEFS